MPSRKTAAKQAPRKPPRKSCEPIPAADPALANRFHRLALALAGTEEGSHCGATDFRTGGRIFATLAYVDRNLGNLMLTPDQQQIFLSESPEWFLPVSGGWGRMGITSVRLEAPEDVIAGALATAHRRIAEKQAAKQAKRKASA